MKLSPDETVFWEYGFINLNLTIVTTWAIMLVLAIVSWWITRNLKKDIQISRWQSLLEIIVITINNQIEEIGISKPAKYIGFIGTLFLFIATANLFVIFPWYQAPTGSISTTAALALCVFFAVPFFGISEKGIQDYLKSYVQPTIIMLPFNLIGEVSRTLALAIRLFGNIMSGGIIVAILLSVAPLLFPIIMNAIGLLTGMVQAYIFSILATVYIAAAVKNTKSMKT
ncbi:MAG: F0F1 ATP synthase subunit A [Lutibacter sp.]|jgi:F-type H+-transporting ATPase subunit a|nr:F0F1 ATP synthase subunit A [Lutibacter sp.]